jgi:NitT/TauT family transport system permease protein
VSLSAHDKLLTQTAIRSARNAAASARFTIRGHMPARMDAFIGVAGIAIFLILWSVLSYGKLVNPFALPTPTSIGRTFVQLYESGQLLMPIWRSFWRVLRALVLATAIGVPIGMLMGAFAPVDAFLRKLVNGAKAVPITGLTALVTLWFGLEEGGKVFYIFLGSVFYMIILVKNAIISVNEEYTKVALDLGGNRWQIFWRVLFFGALPQIWEAIAVCSGIMWTYIILAEFLNSSTNNLGVGGVLLNASRQQQPPRVFCMLIVIAIISSLTDFLIHLVRRRFFNW